MAVPVYFKGIDAASLYAAALAVPSGQQKAKYTSDVLAALGPSPIFEVRVSSTVIYRTTVPGSIPSAASGILLPGTLTEPPTVNGTAFLVGNKTALVALRNASNAAIEISAPLQSAGDPALYLLANKNFNGTDLLRLVNVLFKSPTTLDAVAPPSGGSGTDASWLQVALTDMRKDPSTGNYSYMDSYAVNGTRPLHRNETSYSSQSDRAQLTMNRYPNTQAFTTTNPDYQSELSYVSGSDPARTTANWDRIIFWAQIYNSADHADGNHAAGYTGNSRVLLWNAQIWVKRTSGIWERIVNVNPDSGEAWRPNFREGPSGPNFDMRTNDGGTGFTSYRPVPALGLDSGGRYWQMHPYGGLGGWNTANIAEVLVSCKTALVRHDTSLTDDRDASRFVAACGADYYAPNSSGGSGSYLYGAGTSKHKQVRAKYPDFQYHVMHTATWNDLAASYPDVNS